MTSERTHILLQTVQYNLSFLSCIVCICKFPYQGVYQKERMTHTVFSKDLEKQKKQKTVKEIKRWGAKKPSPRAIINKARRHYKTQEWGKINEKNSQERLGGWAASFLWNRRLMSFTLHQYFTAQEGRQGRDWKGEVDRWQKYKKGRRALEKSKRWTKSVKQNCSDLTVERKERESRCNN